MVDNEEEKQRIAKNLIIFLLAIVGSMFVTALISMQVTVLMEGSDSILTFDTTNINTLRVLQIIQSMGVFIIPSIIGVRLFYNGSVRKSFGAKRVNAVISIISIAVILFSLPFINWSAFVNQNIHFPAALSHIKEWMILTESQAIEATRSFLNIANTSDFLITVLIMAILPAIGEEWLFRGLLQPMLGRLVKNMDVAIIITAIIFSSVHVQFMTFLPRMILGMILGYLFYFGGSLWYSIIAHFVNNLAALISYMFYLKNAESQPDPLMAAAEAPPVFLSIASFVMIAAGIYIVQQRASADTNRQW